MRRLLVFLASTVCALAVIGAANRVVDPFGYYYDGATVARAFSAGEPCLVSVNFTGAGAAEATYAFKRDLLRRVEPRTVVVGSSPVFPLAAHRGERGFVNLGLPNSGVDTLMPLFRAIRARTTGPVTVYVGASPFWFNASFDPDFYGDAAQSTRTRLRNLAEGLRYAFAPRTFTETLGLLVRAPGGLLDAELGRVGGRCVLERGERVSRVAAEAWEPDGSLSSRWWLHPEARDELPVSDAFERDLVRFETSFYRNWSRADRGALRRVDEALAQARRWGWTVVGYGPPYAERYVRRLAALPETRDGWREYGALVPGLFRQHGFPFLDLRRVRDVPCADDAFDYGNDGFHIDRRCATRVRGLLDRAARDAREEGS